MIIEEYKIGFRPMRSESLPYKGEMLKAVIVWKPDPQTNGKSKLTLLLPGDKR